MSGVNIGKHMSCTVSCNSRDAVLDLFEGSYRLCVGNDNLYLEIDELADEQVDTFARLSAILLNEDIDLCDDEFSDVVAIVLN